MLVIRIPNLDRHRFRIGCGFVVVTVDLRASYPLIDGGTRRVLFDFVNLINAYERMSYFFNE